MNNWQNKNNKTIWLLNHYAITPNMPGGTRHYDFAKELIKRGYKVTIFASSFHYTQHKELKLKGDEKYKIENIDGINFVWIKTFPYKKNDWQRVINMISYMHRAYWLGRKITDIDKNIKKPYIILGSTVHLLAPLSAYWLSKYYKVKFIMEVRDLWPQTLIDFGKFKKNNIIIKILQSLEKFLYKKAQKIIVLLPKAEKYIPNGVDLIKFKNIEHINYNKKFNLLYLGAHGIANALTTILDSVKIIQEKNYNNIKFIFVGDGSEKKNLIKYKNKLKLKNTEFYNPVPKMDIPSILTKVNTSVICQQNIKLYKYGFSYNKLFDYMASAKPILLAGNPINNLIDISKCGITVPPENPEKMAEAIIKLYNMPPQERKKMGQRGREYVEKYHGIPVLVDKLEKVFKEVTQN